MKHDLVIKGGTCVTASEMFNGDLGITDGRIAALGEGLHGKYVIDATGKLVMPGGIEAHAHIAQNSATGGMTADDYTSGSISAAFGGNSCIIPFAAQHRGMGVTETLDLYDSRASGASVLDYSYHLIVSDPSEVVLTKELPDAFRRGITSFKLFMTYDKMLVNDAQFLDVLSVAKEHGALTMVHAENAGMIKWMTDRLLARGLKEPKYHALSHPALAEEEAIHRAICMAKLVDAPLLIVHVSTPEGAALVQKARQQGAKIYGETCPQYLFLTRNDMDRPDMQGAAFMCSPPLRDAATQTALWQHIQSGTFDVVSSDHSPYRMDDTGKLAHGMDAPFTVIANGMPGIGARLPLLFSEGVGKGRISLPEFVALSSTNAARLYGLLPKKGTLAVGADADIAIWDPNKRGRISADNQHDNAGYSAFEGWEVTGLPVTVLSRGIRVIDGGALHAQAGHGQFLARAKFEHSGRKGYLAPELDPTQNFGVNIAP
ncbi:MAG: dihydropyrimidinase [Planktotalea sp.]|uniref:dihydropyrimidinase n=1 Tax=Planktotalea sp. TaxID=2029877 RepID=UPI003C70777C